MNFRTTPLILTLFLGATAIAAVQTSDFEVPNTFVAGTAARASEVNQNFDAVSTEINLLDLAIDDVNALIDGLPIAIAPENLLVVARSGGNFTSISSALATTTDSAANNPYAVYVAPGVYTESDLCEVRPFVHLLGAGRGVSVLSSARSNSTPNAGAAAVRLHDLGMISNITVRNTHADSNFTVGILGDDLSSSTLITEAEVIADGFGGDFHFAVHFRDCDVSVTDSTLRAEGAALANAAFSSFDNLATAQPTIHRCELQGIGSGSGIGMRISDTAANVFDTTIRGDFRGVVASLNGFTELQDVRISTLGSPWAEVQGNAGLQAAGCYFVAADALGNPSRLKYVWCIKPNYDPVTNGLGSSVQ